MEQPIFLSRMHLQPSTAEHNNKHDDVHKVSHQRVLKRWQRVITTAIKHSDVWGRGYFLLRDENERWTKG
jgi:hypothetical protein